VKALFFSVSSYPLYGANSRFALVCGEAKEQCKIQSHGIVEKRLYSAETMNVGLWAEKITEGAGH